MAVIKYLLYSGAAVCDIVKAAIIRIITHLPFTILYSNSIAVYVYLYIPSSMMFQFFLIFFPFASLRSCDCLGMLLTECNKLGLLSDSNTVNLTSKRYGFLCYQKTCDYGYFRTKITYISF